MKSEEVREIYNIALREKYKGTYEYRRWFGNPIARTGYEMTKSSVKKFIFSIVHSPKRYLEVGPGPGTWTKIFYEYFGGDAQFDLVDISDEMLDESKKTFSGKENVQYINSDFITFTPGGSYDLFFSSRALEYFPDKNAFAAKISSLLNKEGIGFVTTKTPKYKLEKFLGRKVPEFHAGQIEPEALKELFEKNGLSEVKLYPVTVTFPLFHSASLNMLLWKAVGRGQLNPISKFFSESYGVAFKKT